MTLYGMEYGRKRNKVYLWAGYERQKRWYLVTCRSMKG
jgi:hypothetical protein